jgi:hypothetical protein
MNETWWTIFTDHNHIIAELLWTIIQDFVIVGLLYKVIFKRYILPKIQEQVHADIDKEHGITHD